MKSLLFSLSALLIIGSVHAQPTTISATFKGTEPQKIQFYLLYADDSYDAASVNLEPDKNGQIKKLLQLPYPVFALLQFDQRRQRLLLSPGRDLQLTITSDTIIFAGRAAPENQLVQTTVLNKVPFFIRPEKGDTFLEKLSVTGFKDTVIRQVEEEITATNAHIEKLKAPANLKKLLADETVYAYQCYLTDFTSIYLRRHLKKDADSATSLVMQWKPLPDSILLQSGYYANMMMEKRQLFETNQISAKYRHLGRQGMLDKYAEYLGMPFNVIDSMIRIYGQRAILVGRYAELHLPVSLQDKIYFNLLYGSADLADINTFTFLLQRMQEKYPASQYLVRAKNLLQELTARIKANKDNPKIQIEDLGKMTSVLEVIKKYEGKVIYLDMWGTWCGPCKEEMAYVPELKKRYAGNQNLVFLYIALEKPEQDQQWREFIFLNNMEGKHYRVNRSAIEAFWQEAKTAGVKELNAVPRYMIIDAQGKIVQDVAERPSSRQKLYDQLDKLL